MLEYMPSQRLPLTYPHVSHKDLYAKDGART